MAGRKKKLTRNLIKTVAGYVRAGLPFYKAAEAAHICVGSHKRYMAQGRLDQREGRFGTLEFRYLTAIREAKAQLAEKLLGRMMGMAMSDDSPHTFRATKWMAERCLPEDYAPRAQLNLVEGEIEEVDADIDDLKSMSDEQLQAYAAIADMTDEQIRVFLGKAKGD